MEYTIKLTEDQLRLVGIALGMLPYKDVAALVPVLQKQVDDQKKESVS